MDHTVQHAAARIGPLLPGTNAPQPAGQTAGGSQGISFDQVLKNEVDKQEGVRFSMHAQERMRMRNIPLSSQDIDRLNGGINQVAEKGGRESLVLMGSSAFLVSVPNRTVITAIDGQSLKDNVFTNIDSAVIV